MAILSVLNVLILLWGCDFATSKESQLLNQNTAQTSYEIFESNTNDSLLGGDYSSLTALSLSDDDVEALSLPFAFEYFGEAFSHAYLSSNGLVSFGPEPLSSAGAQQASPGGQKLSGGDKLPQGNGNAAGQQHVVVLHRDRTHSHVTALVSEVGSRHKAGLVSGSRSRSGYGSGSGSSFRGRVRDMHPHLRMFTVDDVSESALEYLSSHADVLSVHESRDISIALAPGEDVDGAPKRGSDLVSPASEYSWGLDRIDQTALPLDNQAYVPPADTNRGSGVSVYVLDTGLDTLHMEFDSAAGYSREVSNIFDYFDTSGGSVGEDTDGHGYVWRSGIPSTICYLLTVNANRCTITSACY